MPDLFTSLQIHQGSFFQKFIVENDKKCNKINKNGLKTTGQSLINVVWGMSFQLLTPPPHPKMTSIGIWIQIGEIFWWMLFNGLLSMLDIIWFYYHMLYLKQVVLALKSSVCGHLHNNFHFDLITCSQF